MNFGKRVVLSLGGSGSVFVEEKAVVLKKRKKKVGRGHVRKTRVLTAVLRAVLRAMLTAVLRAVRRAVRRAEQEPS